MKKKSKLPEGEQTLNTIDTGIKYIRKRLYPTSMADERITDFIVYQLYRKRDCWYNLYTSDMFDDYAISKYYTQFVGPNKRPGMNYYIDLWLEEGGLSRHKITEMISAPKPNKLQGLVYMPSEELIKRRFYNTDNGFLLCQNNTTGYSPRSTACSGCKYDEECEYATKKKYPELLRLRKKDYENGNKEK